MESNEPKWQTKSSKSKPWSSFGLPNSTFKMRQHGVKINENGTANQAKVSPGVFSDPFDPARAPTEDPRAPTRGLRAPGMASGTPVGVRKGGANVTENRPIRKQKATLISGRCLGRFGVTKVMNMGGSGGTQSAPGTAVDEFWLGEG